MPRKTPKARVRILLVVSDCKTCGRSGITTVGNALVRITTLCGHCGGSGFHTRKKTTRKPLNWQPKPVKIRWTRNPHDRR